MNAIEFRRKINLCREDAQRDETTLYSNYLGRGVGEHIV